MTIRGEVHIMSPESLQGLLNEAAQRSYDAGVKDTLKRFRLARREAFGGSLTSGNLSVLRRLALALGAGREW